MVIPSPNNGGSENGTTVARLIDISVQLGVVGMLLIWCFYITRPFILPAVWGIIIATAIHPAFARLNGALGGRSRTTAVIMTIMGLLLLLMPTLLFTGSLIESGQWLATGLQEGTLEVPPPPKNVEGWPVVGPRLYELWGLANTNLEATMRELGPELTSIGTSVLSAAADVGLGILQFVISIVVAGVLLASASSGQRIANSIATRLAGDSGPQLIAIAGATVRSVAQGILGVAVIQATLLAIGLFVAGIPHAGLLAVLCLLFAVIQLPPILVLIPVIVYMFSNQSTLSATLFTVWSVLASSSDNLLKPMLLGRGIDVPTIVIFMGAIGGFITTGFVGLFVGAVIVALAYELFIAWLEGGEKAPMDESAPSASNETVG